MPERNTNQNNENNNDKKKIPGSMWIVLAVAIFLLMYFMITVTQQMEQARLKEVTYNEFTDMVKEGKVSEVYVEYSTNRILITSTDEQDISNGIQYYTGYVDSDSMQQLLDQYNIKYSFEVKDTTTSIFDILLALLPYALLIGAMWFVFRMLAKNTGGMMGVGKSNAKVYVEKETGITFKDVAGQEEAKESISELVDFLHNPGKYARIGAKLPKGALLVGPPGTGKTLLAKAVAGEAKVPFFSLTGSDFVEMFVGVGASRVRDLFKQAQSQAPCIIFIDEIDAIGKSRDNQYGGGNDEREQTLNQLLSEMDGFDPSKGVVILAATNRPEILDKALLRPGRFDRRVIVDKPDLKGRVETLRVHAKNVLMHDSVDLEAIGLATSGAVGSDLANIINEAAILAVKEGRSVVTQSDLFESVEVVIAGKEKKDRILGPQEKRIVACHEVGHALITALEKKAEPVQKITIVPRTMGSLGYVMQVPEEEKYLMSKEELITRITTLFGGRAAEEAVFHSVTTGASNDIEQATSLARAMITQYGMSEKFGLIGLESQTNRYLDGRSVLNCADTTAAEIDHEVMDLLKECHDRAYEMISQNLDVLEKIADFLVEKETITGKEFMKIFNEAKGISTKVNETADGNTTDAATDEMQHEQSVTGSPDSEKSDPEPEQPEQPESEQSDPGPEQSEPEQSDSEQSEPEQPQAE